MKASIFHQCFIRVVTLALLTLGVTAWSQIAPTMDTPPPPGLVDTVKADTSALPDNFSLLPVGDGKPVQDIRDLSALEHVAILHEGRLKPVATFAGHVLLQLSGKRTYEKRKAVDVLAHILFAPETVGDWKLFLINNPEVAQAMGIPEEKSRRYSLKELQKGLHKLQQLAEKADQVSESKRTITDKEFLRVWSNVFFLVQLGRTFSFAIPGPEYALHTAEAKQALGLATDRNFFSFWELMAHAPSIAAVLEAIGNRQNTERQPYENEIISASQTMFLNSQNAQPSPFKILPPTTPENTDWVSPPEAVATPDRLQLTHTDLDQWVKALESYRQGNADAFTAALKNVNESVTQKAWNKMAQTHFDLELIYQKIDPLFQSLWLYWVSLLLCFVFFLRRHRWLYLSSIGLFGMGYVLHLSGIISRIVIMHRPPVTSLYETFPFVAAVAILAALVIEQTNRRAIGLLCANILGVILLSIANRYAAEGDTLKMLVAVLNSNFWLSTHVICITIGYSACLLCGAIGHVWLVRALLPGGSDKKEQLREIQKMIYGTLGFGLLFSFIGTVLGGIWADQSWGRFWGWDPKENGALLIVIWCVILLHARWWGKIRDLGVALGSVFGAIVVSLAWFGVNLLNVGLHSYGFTTGAATKLFVYIGIELVFMAITGIWIQTKKARLLK